MGKTGGFILGAVIGGTAAAVAALLTESGKELRGKLAKQVDDLLDVASDYSDIAKDRGVDFANLAKEKANQFAQQADDLAGTIKDKSLGSVNNIKRIQRTLSIR